MTGLRESDPTSEFEGSAGIEKRRRGDGEHVSCGGVHQHGPSVVAAYFLHAFGEALFQIALHIDIDRYHDVLAVLRRLVYLGAARDRHARRASLHHEPARNPLEDIVVIQLEPRDALAVHVDESEHLACDFSVRIDALGVVDEIDARQALILERVGLVGIGLTLQVDERRVLSQQLFIRGESPPSVSAQRGGRGRNVFYLFRDWRRRRGIDACGEHVAVAIVYGAAAGQRRSISSRARRRRLFAIFRSLDRSAARRDVRRTQGDNL